MTISLQEFKDQTLGGSYGTPPPVLIRDQGTYIGQCVSYCRQYCEAVLGIKTKAWGNAADWWTNPEVLVLFDRITGEANRQDGDILVWGDDTGNFTGPAGHDAIAFDGGKILNQNYNNSLRVSVNLFFSPGYLGALRLKGDQMEKVTNESCYNAFNGILMRPPTKYDLDTYVDKWTLSSLIALLMTTNERTTVFNQWTTGRQAIQDEWQKQIVTLTAENEALKKDGTQLKSGKYIVS